MKYPNINVIINISITNIEKVNKRYLPIPFLNRRSTINPIKANGYKIIEYNPPLLEVINEIIKMHKKNKRI